MNKDNLLKDKLQTVQIEFSNGARGVFIGKACVSNEERAKVSVTGIFVGETEDVTDEIRAKIMEGGDDEAKDES